MRGLRVHIRSRTRHWELLGHMLRIVTRSPVVHQLDAQLTYHSRLDINATRVVRPKACDGITTDLSEVLVPMLITAKVQ
ncbi:hypothetical protein D9M69_369360 [compost metagenome]